MSGYTKLFNSILASTIWRADDQTRLVWITMLAMADRSGVVEASVPGIADFARVSLPDCERALEVLSSPDEYSRTKSHQGRRIRVVEGGWHIINHGKYRKKLGADERREYLKIKQREYRKKRASSVNTKSTPVNNVSDTYTGLTQAEAEADPKAEAEKREKSVSLSPAAPLLRKPKKPDVFLDASITERAGRFIDRYQELYREHRKGARYLVRPVLDYQAAVELCTTWTDDARLEQIATIFLLTDHKFAEEGSRTIPQFKALASWCDSRLAEHEASHARA